MTLEAGDDFAIANGKGPSIDRYRQLEHAARHEIESRETARQVERARELGDLIMGEVA